MLHKHVPRNWDYVTCCTNMYGGTETMWHVAQTCTEELRLCDMLYKHVPKNWDYVTCCTNMYGGTETMWHVAQTCTEALNWLLYLDTAEYNSYFNESIFVENSRIMYEILIAIEMIPEMY